MSTVDVQQVLALPAHEVGTALLALPEDQWFDRKSPRIAPRDLADAAIAFANAEGGVIVLGLWNGMVQGVGACSSGQRNAWRQASIDHAVPPIRSTVRVVPCRNDDGQTDELLVLEVEPSTQVHANPRDEVFLRVGDENRRLTFGQRRELLFEKGQASFEAQALPQTSVAGIDRKLLHQYARALRHPDPDRLLHARGLVTSNGRVTVAGELLFGVRPQRHLPQALVRVLRYRGTERGSGRRQQLMEDVRVEGPIPRMLDEARQRIEALLPGRRALGEDGRFHRMAILPRDAWLEGLVNAVVHRSYSMSGDHIRFEIFDDRIETESPGRFPGLADLDYPLSITRFARNPRIARVCADLQFGQELGEGIRRMFDEMRLAGLVEPRYVQTAGTVRLTLSAEPLDRELDQRLPAGARTVMRVLRRLGRASTGQLVEETGITRPSLLRKLRALQEAGLVEWVGTSKKDPRAFWRVLVE